MAAYAGPDTELRPNVDHMRDFVGWWFERCNKGMIEIGWVDNKGRGLVHFAQFDLDNINELVATAVQANIVPGQSCYIRACTVREGPDFTTDADFVQSPGIWNDIDTPEQVQQAKSVQTIIRPNAAVITGTQPHTRVQNWFKSTEPIVNAELVRSLNKRIHKLYGGDQTVINPSRLMRLPGTIAWPWKKDRTTPELTIFVLPPASDPRPLSYPLSMLTSQLPGEQEGRQEAPNGARGSLNSAAEMIRLIRTGSEWHNNVIRLVAHWIGRGWSNAEILIAAEAFTIPGYTNNQTIAEVSKAIEGARRKWGVNDPEHIVGTAPDNPFPTHVIDPWDTLQPPAFPIESLPGILRAYVESRARVMGADPCAIAWAALSACSAALDGRTRLRMKRHDTWSVPPPLWVALIGSSSVKKTPIITDAWKPLDTLQGVALRAYADQLRRWNVLSKDEKKDTPPPPKPIRLLSHDTTMEGLQEILSHQNRGIGILRDELAGFIGAMDKYQGKGNGGAADRAFWLQAYNGGSHVVDRVSRGTISIENLLVTLCGGIQPERLAQFADIADDGLFQRFLPFIVKPGAMGLDEEPGPAVEAYTVRLQGMVDAVPAGGATFSNAAHDIRSQVEHEVYDLERSAPFGPRFTSFVGKLPGVFGRLALVLSYVEPSGLGYVVSEHHARMAHALIRNCVIPHASRVYPSMGNSDGTGVEDMRAVAGYILAKKVERLVSSDLGRKVRTVFRTMTVSAINQLLSPLVAGGWLVPERDGNPANRTWLVNPIVHTTFNARAATEAGRRAQAHELLTGEPENDG